MIFVGSSGIAVRTIGPLAVSKKTDPAVLVVDDQLQYVIPILSGHLGGANEIACRLASLAGAGSGTDHSYRCASETGTGCFRPEE